MIKMNKKGFTLIEMLVVIAIIAILVSIIIPTVQSATYKAAAATNAANLRSVKAEATTNYLMTGQVTPHSNPAPKEVPGYSTKTSELKVATAPVNGDIKVTFGDTDIDTFAKIASGEIKIGK